MDNRKSRSGYHGAKGHVRFTPDSERESEFPQTVPVRIAPEKRTATQTGISAKGHKRTSRQYETDVQYVRYTLFMLADAPGWP